MRFFTNDLFHNREDEDVYTALECQTAINSAGLGVIEVDEYLGDFAFNYLIDESGVEDDLVDYISFFCVGDGRCQYVLNKEGEQIECSRSFDPYTDLEFSCRY